MWDTYGLIKMRVLQAHMFFLGIESLSKFSLKSSKPHLYKILRGDHSKRA